MFSTCFCYKRVEDIWLNVRIVSLTCKFKVWPAGLFHKCPVYSICVKVFNLTRPFLSFSSSIRREDGRNILKPSSDSFPYNKHIAHNSFAVPSLKSTFGLLNQCNSTVFFLLSILPMQAFLQVSVLGPSLFLLYINHLPAYVLQSINICADDSTFNSGLLGNPSETV